MRVFQHSMPGVRCLSLVALALMTAFLAPPVTADDGKWDYKWSNGFKLKSSDGAFDLAFGGRLMLDYTFVDADDALVGRTDGDGFEMRRGRLFFKGTIYERIVFKVNYDFAGGDADAKDVYVGIKNDWGTVLFGHYKEDFSFEELASSKYIPFLERSLPTLAFAPSRNSGVGAHGKRGDTFNWGVGAYYDADGFATSSDEDNINITGRVAFRPLYEDKGKRLFHVALAASNKDRESSIRFRARPEAHDTGRFVDTGSFAADGANLYGAELAGIFGPFWFAAESMQIDVDAAAAGDPTFDGSYVQVGYFLTKGDHRTFDTKYGRFNRVKPKEVFLKDGGKGAWEIAARVSTLDLNDGSIFGGEQDNWSLALNWYPNPATRMMINWVHADVDNVGEADFFLLRWQVDF